MFTKSYAGAGLREAITILNASNRLGSPNVRRLILLISGSDADDTQSADTMVRSIFSLLSIAELYLRFIFLLQDLDSRRACNYTQKTPTPSQLKVPQGTMITSGLKPYKHNIIKVIDIRFSNKKR